MRLFPLDLRSVSSPRTIHSWARAADVDFDLRAPGALRDKVQFGPLAPLPLRVKHAVRQSHCTSTAETGHERRAARKMRPGIQPAPDLIRAASNIKADLYIAHYHSGASRGAQGGVSAWREIPIRRRGFSPRRCSR